MFSAVKVWAWRWNYSAQRVVKFIFKCSVSFRIDWRWNTFLLSDRFWKIGKKEKSSAWHSTDQFKQIFDHKWTDRFCMFGPAGRHSFFKSENILFECQFETGTVGSPNWYVLRFLTNFWKKNTAKTVLKPEIDTFF